MSIEGRIAIDVSFSDSTSASGVQSLKRIALTSTDSYSTGKVAVLTGTVGTAAVTLAVAPSVYRDASGAFVSFSTITRVAYKSSGATTLSDLSTDAVMKSDADAVAVTAMAGNQGDGLSIAAGSGTSTYTVVIYGT